MKYADITLPCRTRLFVRVVGRITARLMPHSLTVQEGGSATLVCRTSGKPVDEIRWFKDTQPLTTTNRISAVAVRWCTLWYV